MKAPRKRKCKATTKAQRHKGKQGGQKLCTPELIEKMRLMVERNDPDKTWLARWLGVSRAALANWLNHKSEHYQAEFAQAYRAAHLYFLETVEVHGTYIGLATGFEREVEETMMGEEWDKDAREVIKKPMVVKLTKYFPPQERAGRNILNNKGIYREKIDVNGKLSVTVADLIESATDGDAKTQNDG